MKEKKIVIFSGAGISAESGIKTFRDADGLWENHSIEEICNQYTWEKNYEQVHKFYNQRRVQLADVEPNLAHEIVAQIKEKYQDDCIVITQNVDDMFERAGCRDVIHVHGELTKMHCMSCNNVFDIGYKEFTIGEQCPKCGNSHIKPYVVFFGGQAPKYMDMYSAFEYLQNEDSIAVVIGTLGNVIQISANLELMDCKKILNNLEISPYIDDSQFDRVYYENATSAIEKIEADIEEFWEIE
ncbi:NAD-dependent deacetylase [Sulfurimonas sp.]|uniref:SIR2 family NAD-dependent protein deacylase n=1 Tax=Sulfurimonas sp. TaxID=2022749 RepID=UPI00356A0922